MRDAALWDQLRSFPLDNPSDEFPFSEKLAKTQGWSKRATLRAIDEYRKFLYLAAVSDGKVTPSADVDRVWHLHLTYTHNYWDRLCAQVLGGALHHEPATGPAEAPRFAAQYRRTHALYEEEFGVKPPRAVWSRPMRAPSERGVFGRGAIMVAIAGVVFVGLYFVPFELTTPIQAAMAAGLGLILGGIGAVSARRQNSRFAFGVDVGGGDGDGGGCGD